MKTEGFWQHSSSDNFLIHRKAEQVLVEVRFFFVLLLVANTFIPNLH
jgi:hypothetical protein